LPTRAVQKIKFVSKSTLKEFVEADQALTCWGGLDDYTYKFVPEVMEPQSGRIDDNRKKVSVDILLYYLYLAVSEV
jgi:hypothetical protein